MDKRISIVVVSDDYYSILLVAFLKSIEMNHKTDEIVDVYIIDDNISKNNVEKITNSLCLDKMVLNWIEMKDAIPKDMNLPFVINSYPINIFVRLLIPYFIPSHIKKVIYFDVDMIMQDDISNLWKIDIGDFIVGAVSDTIGPVVRIIGEGVKNYAELGLNPNEKYFNSGLLVINIERWLAENITQNTLETITKNKKYASLSDQYGLNVTIIGKWYEIDSTWSCFSVRNLPNPSLIHYFHRKPIFKEYSYNYREEFYYYLNQTQWKGFKPIGKMNRYYKKAKDMVQKIEFLSFK